MAEEAIVVFCTVPNAETGRAIANGVIGERLAACANILPAIESIYRWKGVIETGSENLLIIKSTTWKYQLLEAKILELHPYDTPEIISVRADSGSVKYLQWIEESVS